MPNPYLSCVEIAIVDHVMWRLRVELRKKPKRVHTRSIVMLHGFIILEHLMIFCTLGKHTHRLPSHPAVARLCSLERTSFITLSLTFIGNVWGGKLLLDGFHSNKLMNSTWFCRRTRALLFRPCDVLERLCRAVWRNQSLSLLQEYWCLKTATAHLHLLLNSGACVEWWSAPSTPVFSVCKIKFLLQ